MNSAFRFAVLIAGTGVVLGCTSESGSLSDQEMIAAADALDEAFVAAFNAGDADALSSLYWNDPQVVSFPPDSLQLRGLAAIRDGNAEMFSSMPGAMLELTEGHQVPVGDAVVGWGLWRLAMPGPNGEQAELIGRYTDVKALRDGKWVYLVDHASVPLPAASE